MRRAGETSPRPPFLAPQQLFRTLYNPVTLYAMNVGWIVNVMQAAFENDVEGLCML